MRTIKPGGQSYAFLVWILLQRGLVCSRIEMVLSVFRNKALFLTELLVSYHLVFNIYGVGYLEWNQQLCYQILLNCIWLPILHGNSAIQQKWEGSSDSQGGMKVGGNQHQLAFGAYEEKGGGREVGRFFGESKVTNGIGWLLICKIYISKHFTSYKGKSSV